MDETTELMDRLAHQEGINNTFLNGIRIFKTSRSRPRQPLLYRQGAIIVGQGTKRVYLDDRVYEYNPDRYLVLTVPLPAECETLASATKPVLLMTLDFDLAVLNRILGRMDRDAAPRLTDKRRDHQGLFVAETTQEIKDATVRLLRALQSQVESKILGEEIVHELLYRILCGENAASLCMLTMQNTNLAKVHKALEFIHGNFQDSLDVDKLAGIANMSSSAFHRAFKEVTASSPIQYVKRTRLEKAKSLLWERGFRVNEAATAVGYASATQFSREFKRHFGESPVQYTPRHDAAKS